MKQYNIGNSELQEHNPWWVKADFIEEDPRVASLEHQRYVWSPEILVDFPPSENGIITLRGPRQVGKTTLLKLLIRKLLLKQRIDPVSVFFMSCDRVADYDELYALVKSYLDFARPRTRGRLFCFLDEISFVREWPRAIKSLVDAGALSNALVLLTGSNALDIKFSSERMPGRRGEIFQPDWEILPLDFQHYLSLVAPDIACLTHREAHVRFWPEIKKLFEDWLLSGGFLSAINRYAMEGSIPPYIYELYWNWIEGDLNRVKRSPDVALAMFERIFAGMTSTTSAARLARESGVASHVTASDYLDILRRMYVVNILDCFLIDQKRRDPKKNRKVYFTDPFILSCVLAKNRGFLDDAFGYARQHLITAEAMPKIAEMCVADALVRRASHLSYGSSGKLEVDFVTQQKGVLGYVEVKYREAFAKDSYAAVRPLLITQEEISEEEPRCIPLELFLGFTDQVIAFRKTAAAR